MAVHKGYLLIADITGYTQYLSASELEHAQQTLTALLSTLIQHTRPPLVISRLAGDAVISYGIRERFVAGQTFAEMLEETYINFRRAIELMVRNTTCPCNACRNIPSLDLKFFVHYGEFAVQKLDAHEELVGSDVNLIHRLLKNRVAEETGIRAYALFTDAALAALGLGDDAPAMGTLTETYEHLGPVTIHVRDMHPLWEARRSEAQVRIPPREELLRIETVIRASPELVWNNVVQPENFNVLLGGDRGSVSRRRGGRVAKGSVYNCYHGDAVIENVVVGWVPFTLLTLEFALPMPIPGVTVLAEVTLSPVPEGTRVTEILSRSRGPLLGRIAGDAGIRAREGHQRKLLDDFRALVEKQAASIVHETGGAAIATGEIAAAARASLAATGTPA